MAIQRVSVRNSDRSVKTLCVEPWADEFRMKPGDEWQIVFDGSDSGHPAVDLGSDRVTVYGWSGSTAAVYCEGAEVAVLSNPVPQMPLS
jgi:hypothetical protein